MPGSNNATLCTHARPAPKEVDTLLALAEDQCAAKGLRLTERRRDVLQLLLREHRALGAYEILDLLRLSDQGKASPPIAYRALDFLTEHGFAHKIERLSAFVACVHPDQSHAPAFMICRCCHHVTEAHVDQAALGLGSVLDDTGFAIERTMIEIEGLCAHCTDQPAA